LASKNRPDGHPNDGGDTQAAAAAAAEDCGWIACTTDDVLATKISLYDVLVTIPPAYSQHAAKKAWPRIQTSSGTEIKASQRDLRRYRTLRQDICRAAERCRGASTFGLDDADQVDHVSDEPEDDQNDSTPLLPANTAQEPSDDDDDDGAASTSDETLVEPLSWSALAYNSFMWWASAGEKAADLDEEVQRDTALFRSFDEYADPAERGGPPSGRRGSSPGDVPVTPGSMVGTSSALPEMAVIAYFHRLSATILGTLAEVVAREDGSDRDGGGDGADEEAVFVGSEDMVRMGLDVWSEGDRVFVKELVEFYWGRAADVHGGQIRCCGVRIL
jgi:hypothetical protein